MNTQFLLKGFKRPKEVLKSVEQTSPTKGRYIIEPLERGFGITVGNALRRTLLSSVPGYAVTAVKFESALHEFSTIKGVVEDVPEIILNLKQVAVALTDGQEARVIEVEKKGPAELTAGDLAVDAGVRILNPDLLIAHVAPEGHLRMRLQIELGRGYVAAEEIKDRIGEEGTIPIDATFTPVRKVSFTVSDLRLGNRSDYNRLVMEVETNGALTAEEAVGYAAKILKEIFAGLVHFTDYDEEAEAAKASSDASVLSAAARLLKTPVEDLELSVRSLHGLQAADIRTIEELVRRDAEELLKVKNFGERSLEEIREKLAKHGLRLGMSEADVRDFLERAAEEGTP